MTDSPAMQVVARAVEAVAESHAPVLISGELGCGRELVARVLHGASDRHECGFVAVSATLAPQALGYDPGRCTFDDVLGAARGGTLLIRDVGDLPRAFQPALRDLADAHEPGRGHHGPRSVRLIGTCEPELGAATEAGLFDRDLYASLAGHHIAVPPLRERLEDIPRLYSDLVRDYAAELGRGRMTISSRVHDRLCAYTWPGNVAELRGVARRGVIRASANRIEAGDIDACLPTLAQREPLEAISFEEMVRSKLAEFLRRVDGYPLGRLYDDVLSRVERPLLQLLMEHTGGNQVRAAEILGLNRNTVRRKLIEHGLLSRNKAVSGAKEENNAVRRGSSQAPAASGASRRVG